MKLTNAINRWLIGKINDKEYEDIYKYILDYDTKRKDEASFKKSTFQ